MMNDYHSHHLLPNQCGSSLVQTIDAPLPFVWSIIRLFDHPQGYKRFIKSCTVCSGSGNVGSVREVMIISDLPTTTSMERLDELDDELHVMVFSIIGGDHKLENYHSTTTLHESEGGSKTVVIELYVVDIPPGNSKEDTWMFAVAIIRFNLKSLASVSEEKVRNCEA